MPRLFFVHCAVAFAAIQAAGCRSREEHKRTWPPPGARPIAPMELAPALRGTPAVSGGAPATNPEARALFGLRCVVCHGEHGKGDGPGAQALKVKPRDYTDAVWQKSVADDFIRQIVLKGGAAVGKDPGMPANPDLLAKPEVVDGLVAIVRSFGPGGPRQGEVRK